MQGNLQARGKADGDPISREGTKWHTRPKPTPSPFGSPPQKPPPHLSSTAALAESRTSRSPPSRRAGGVSACSECAVSSAGARQRLQQPQEAQRRAGCQEGSADPSGWQTLPGRVPAPIAQRLPGDYGFPETCGTHSAALVCARDITARTATTLMSPD